MKLTCPACGAGGSASLFIADTEARQAVLAAAKLPSDAGPWVLKYISLFAPRERFLSAGRAANLITELCDMIINGVDFDRQRIKAPSHIWKQALMSMLDNQKLRRPIKNHHYLLRVVQSCLAERADVSQLARAEGARAAVNRAGSMQKIGDQSNEEDGPELPKGEAYHLLHARAREDLVNEGVRKEFLSKNLIEARMVWILQQEEKENGDNRD